MPPNDRDEHKAGVTGTTKSDSSDPRDTDHPTGAQQAAANAANESPS